jgi:hypothetical protein
VSYNSSITFELHLIIDERRTFILLTHSLRQTVPTTVCLPNLNRIVSFPRSPVDRDSHDHIYRLSRLWRELAPYGRATLRRHLRPIRLGKQEIARHVLQSILVVYWAPGAPEDLPLAEAKRLLGVELRRCAFRLLSNLSCTECSRPNE